MCCCRAICCRALQIGLQERLLLKPLDLKIELKYAESVEYLLGSFLKAVCSRCCWCGRTDVEGWCHVTNWEIIYRVKKTLEQDPESLGNTHLDGRTPQPSTGYPRQRHSFLRKLLWNCLNVGEKEGRVGGCWLQDTPQSMAWDISKAGMVGLLWGQGALSQGLHGFLEHQPEWVCSQTHPKDREQVSLLTD